MAYDTYGLSVLAYVGQPHGDGNGFTMWHYRTLDTVEQVSWGGYFAESDMVRRGDYVIVNAIDGNTAVFV